MPQWDRYWPLGLLSSVLLLTASILLSTWYLASLFALPQQFGLPPLAGLGQMGGSIIWVGGFGGLGLFVSSRAAHRRARLRRVALGGDPSVMPLATIVPDPAHAPDAAHRPLMLPWRRTPRGREWGTPLLLTLLMSPAPVFIAVVTFVFPTLIGWSVQDEIAYLAHRPMDNIIDAAAMALLLALETCLAVNALVALVRALTSRLGPAYGVVADDEGISTLHLKGQGPRLRWADMRLLEVSQPIKSGGGARFFTIYGPDPRTSVYWQYFRQPRRKRLRLESSREEFETRQRSLLALIASRTSLQPRTFSVELTRDEELARQPVRSYRWLAYSLRYGLVGVPLLLAVAVLALPLTHNPLLDGYAATTSALFGIAVLVSFRRTLMPGRAPSPPPAPRYTLPAAPPLATEPIEVTYRRRFTGRLQDFAIGLVLVPDVVPAFAAELNAGSFPLQGFAMHVVAFLTFLLALVGIAALINAFTGRRATLAASTSGLTERRGRDKMELPWDSILLLELELDKDEPEQFSVLSRDGDTLTWPARGVIWRPSRPGHPLISAEELAAVVAQRSGVQLTIKEA